MIVVLGASDIEGAEIAAETLTVGDPSYAGPLAGVALEIPSYHILEQEIMSQVDPALVERELALASLAMDVGEVTAPLKVVRGGNGA